MLDDILRIRMKFRSKLCFGSSIIMSGCRSLFQAGVLVSLHDTSY